MDEFDKHMPTANQLHITRDDVVVTADDLVAIPAGTVTEAGVRKNINVGILYLNAWLSGQGAVALYHLMEDAATAEISRTQIWHWIKNKAVLEDGKAFTKEYFNELFDEEVEKIITEVGSHEIKETQFENAFNLFKELVLAEDFEEFLTTPAYKFL
jgi:malate synthase